jgi:hypothetical protein
MQIQARIFGLVIFIAIWCFWGDLFWGQFGVASDSQKSYEIAKRAGKKMDSCLQAGVTALSYLNAHDEPAYRNWKAIEESECSAAGIPVEAK